MYSAYSQRHGSDCAFMTTSCVLQHKIMRTIKGNELCACEHAIVCLWSCNCVLVIMQLCACEHAIVCLRTCMTKGVRWLGAKEIFRAESVGGGGGKGSYSRQNIGVEQVREEEVYKGYEKTYAQLVMAKVNLLT